MEKALVTVLTPTFNRKEKLKDLYESLCKQTNKNFVWLIIDDGSTDGTDEFYRTIKEKNVIKVDYHYKENGGKHTALNLGISLITTELTFIVDSDDVLSLNAIEEIELEWDKWKDKNLAGINFLKGYDEKKQIGRKFEKEYEIAEYDEIRINRNYQFDIAEIYRTDILKKYPFPVFENEKFIGESIVWNRIGKQYKMMYINKIIYIADYLEDGLTRAGRKLRIQNPLGGMENSIILTSKNYRIRVRIKNMMLYICYGLFAKKKIQALMPKAENKILFIICTIPGYFLYLYWKRKFRI